VANFLHASAIVNWPPRAASHVASNVGHGGRPRGDTESNPPSLRVPGSRRTAMTSLRCAPNYCCRESDIVPAPLVFGDSELLHDGRLWIV